ncbi:hypothetical protein PPMP20_21515 [Paraburkholderia phymatum]|uniref:hypothetical protein n=1 Tax=Paraburkholderia phymatum TaxID=148447 RepID=UPI00059F809B|nr:hypothetical protein [Paraburkholderia phymatum]
MESASLPRPFFARRKRGLPTAERTRHCQRKQAGTAQAGEIVVWKERPRIERGGACAEIGGQRGEPRIGGRTVEVRERFERIGIALDIGKRAIGVAASRGRFTVQ